MKLIMRYAPPKDKLGSQRWHYGLRTRRPQITMLHGSIKMPIMCTLSHCREWVGIKGLSIQSLCDDHSTGGFCQEHRAHMYCCLTAHAIIQSCMVPAPEGSDYSPG